MASSFVVYKQTMKAMEAYDASCNAAEIAMESLQKDMNNIAKDLNPKLNEAAAKYSAAINAAKYDDALKALNELEAVVKEWRHRIESLPAESMSRRALNMTIKVASAVLSAVLIVKSPAIATKATTIIGRYVALPKMAAITMRFGIDFAAGSYGWSTLFNCFSGVLSAKLVGGDRDAHKNEDKAYNRNYITVQCGLDNWTRDIELARSEIKKLRAEEGK